MKVTTPPNIHGQLQIRVLTGDAECTDLTRELLEDVLCEELVDFPMPGHWLRSARLRVAMPIVIAAAPDE